VHPLESARRENAFLSGHDRIYQVGDETEPLLLDMWMAGNTPLPALHAHPVQREHFHVLSGEMRIKIDRDIHDLKSGESVTVDVGVMHAVGNRYDGAAVVFTEISPGLNTQAFFEQLREMESKHLNGLAEIVHYARLVRRFRREYRYSPPVTALFVVSASLGRVLVRTKPERRS
jgi:mannose-6-phosphate isomerase-like protein (cupin superfamily)